MFKRARYVVAVNGSLAALGINPQRVNKVYRRGCQEIGMRDGLSPQEVAVFIAAQLPMAEQPMGMARIISAWEREGKLRPGTWDEARCHKNLSDARVLRMLAGGSP